MKMGWNDIMKRAISNVFMAAAIGATAGTAQIPPEVSEAGVRGREQEQHAGKNWRTIRNATFGLKNLLTQKRQLPGQVSVDPDWPTVRDGLHWSSDPPPEEGRVHDGRSLLFKRGELKDGKKRGKWTVDGFTGIHGYRLEGSYVKGKRHGGGLKAVM